jgi:hypothetical protein
MTLSDLLREKSSSILQRWQCLALATYPEASRRAFQCQQDPFANPVGHALRSGTQAAWEGFVEGRGADEIVACLDEIIKIRAVQEFKPSTAIAFIFSLKDAIRAELGSEDPALALSPEMVDVEARVDRIALGVFDVFTRYRAQVCELRINEIKRSVGRYAQRMSCHSFPRESEEDPSPEGTSDCSQAERGDGR